MKWLVIINKYIPEVVGGNVIYVERFIKQLAQMGHDVTLLTATNDEKSLKYEKIDNIEIHRVFIKNGSLGPLRFRDREIMQEKVLSLLEDNNFDIVNPHNGTTFTLEFLKRSKQKYNFSLVSTFHAVHTYEIIFDYRKFLRCQSFNMKESLIFPLKVLLMYVFEYYMLKHSDKVVVMSKYVKGTIKSFFGNKFLDKVLVTGIGVTQPDYPQIPKDIAREKLNLNKDETIFITVRRLVPRMGLDNLIKSFSKIKNSNARLLIIGKGQLQNKLEKLIKKLKLEDKVNLLGFVDNEKLNYYYSSADCFILPTEQLEGFGIVTIEALNYNLPVIGTPMGATPEILNKFDTNLITKTHKAEDIAEKISYYLENKVNYDNVNYKKTVNEEYNWELLIDKILTCEMEK